MFGDRLKKLREDKDLRQKELAKIIGLSDRTIGMYEQGRREPDFNTLTKLADFFNVSIDYLLGRTDQKKISKKSYSGKELADLVPIEWQDAIKEVEYFQFYEKMKIEDINPDDLIIAYNIYKEYEKKMKKENLNNNS